MKFLKQLTFTISFLCLAIFFTLPISAQEHLTSGENITLAREQTINNNYFAAGDNITISGTVNGDAYLTGGNINIDGTINGDLLVAGGNIVITGTITGDIRTVGGNINISGTIGRNITAIGGSIDIQSAAQIAGSLVTAGGNVQIFAPIPQSITAGVGRLYIANQIGGDIVAGVGELTIAPSANIQGNLTYYSDQPANMNSTATITGQVTQHQTPGQSHNPQATNALITGFTIFKFLTSLIVGLLFIKLFPKFAIKSVTIINSRPVVTSLTGLLILLVTPLLAILLLITVLGIPLAIIIFLSYGLALYLAHLFTALYIGEKIADLINQKSSHYLTFILGLLILSILSIIPLLGGFARFLSLIIGIGAIGLTIHNFYQPHKTKPAKSTT